MIHGTYFSDLLCIWAYVAEERTAAIRRTFGDEVQLRHRFCNVFGDAHLKISTGWRDRGGFAGYAKHVAEVAARFPHVRLHPDVWLSVQPTGSMSPHLFLTAIRLHDERAGSAFFEPAMTAMRNAFFRDARDMAQREVQAAIARSLGLDPAALEEFYADGRAHAALAGDYQEAEKLKIEGSPTLVLNEGRQRLFGNVGFRVIEANIRELLRAPADDQASWC